MRIRHKWGDNGQFTMTSGLSSLVNVENASIIRRYHVPSSHHQPPLLPDFTRTYHDSIVKGLDTAGRVHTGRFWRLSSMGDTNIFVARRDPIKRIRASALLLWDFSGSQRDFRADLIHSLQIVGGSLKRLGFSVWAAGYTSDDLGVGIFEVCSFNEAWDHTRAASLQRVKMDDTPSGVALLWTRLHMLPRAPHNKRLIVICTDGNATDSPELQREEVHNIRNTGARLAALYVGPTTGDYETIQEQFDRRYAFHAPTRTQIPLVFSRIVSLLGGGQ